jgi:hypothetical protein
MLAVITAVSLAACASNAAEPGRDAVFTQFSAEVSDPEAVRSQVAYNQFRNPISRLAKCHG